MASFSVDFVRFHSLAGPDPETGFCPSLAEVQNQAHEIGSKWLVAILVLNIFSTWARTRNWFQMISLSIGSAHFQSLAGPGPASFITDLEQFQLQVASFSIEFEHFQTLPGPDPETVSK